MSNIVELIDAEIAGLEQKIAALKAAKAALGGTAPAKKAKAKSDKQDGRKGRVWTQEQKDAIAEKAKARAAAKAAGAPVVTRAKVNLA